MKYYNVELMLYTEEEVIKAIKICNNEQLCYCYATHDKDLKENGEIKPIHTHFQVYSKIQKSIKTWARIFEIEENYIEIIKYKPKAIQYLIHKNNPEKYQYKKEIIQSNFNINQYFKNEETEVEDVRILLEYIEINRKTTLKELMQFALDNSIWSSYRRNYTILKDIINERKMLQEIIKSDKIKM